MILSFTDTVVKQNSSKWLSKWLSKIQADRRQETTYSFGAVPDQSGLSSFRRSRKLLLQLLDFCWIQTYLSLILNHRSNKKPQKNASDMVKYSYDSYCSHGLQNKEKGQKRKEINQLINDSLTGHTLTHDRSNHQTTCPSTCRGQLHFTDPRPRCATSKNVFQPMTNMVIPHLDETIFDDA